MTRLIYVTDSGDDLDGDGSADAPFQTEERAELDADHGDVILIYERDVELPPIVSSLETLVDPGRKTSAISMILVATCGLATGITATHNPAAAAFCVLLTGFVVAVLA